jgi:hypothetical protein
VYSRPEGTADAAGGARAAAAAKGVPPRSAALPVTHQPQRTAYWCGPAAVRMALATRLGAAAPSQAVLARDDNLRTDSCRQTPDRFVIRDVLNRYLGTSRYAVHDLGVPPTPAQHNRFRQDLLRAIGSGWPIVATFWVRRGGARPPGYPDPGGEGIKHIVTIYAYEDGGAAVLVADPASSGTDVDWGAGVPPVYRLPFATAVALMAGKGYVG